MTQHSSSPWPGGALDPAVRAQQVRDQRIYDQAAARLVKEIWALTRAQARQLGADPLSHAEITQSFMVSMGNKLGPDDGISVEVFGGDSIVVSFTTLATELGLLIDRARGTEPTLPV